MPFVIVNQPTMGVSVLKNCLNINGIKTEAHYPCMPLSVDLRSGMYDWCGGNVYERIGDYFFCEYLFGPSDAREEKLKEALYRLGKNGRFPKDIKGIGSVRDLVEYIPSMREIIKNLMHELANFISNRKNIKIVCCSATFVQLYASLAILKEIKRLSPDITTIIGGCECEGECAKEVVKKFDFIDYVCSGEGEVVLPKLCNTALSFKI